MNELEQHFEMMRQRKLAQNERCRKAGKPLKWPKLAATPVKASSKPSKAQKPPMPESGNLEDSAMSFDEWKAAGWCVKKGERFHCTDIMGIPQFILTQVRKLNPAWETFRHRK